MMRRIVALTVASLVAAVAAASAQELPRVKVLLWLGGPIHKHHEIGDVIEPALRNCGRFEVTRVEEDLNALLPDRLAGFDVVLFFNTLGEITEEQKRGIMNFVAGGKVIAGFHSAADSFRGDPDWDALFGGHFITHPPFRKFQVGIPKTDHPITAGMGEFITEDEQYIMDYDSRVQVLAAALHEGKWMPAAWVKDWGKGRVFYTGLGHNPPACQDVNFQRLLLRGTLWAAGQGNLDFAPAPRSGPSPGN